MQKYINDQHNACLLRGYGVDTSRYATLIDKSPLLPELNPIEQPQLKVKPNLKSKTPKSSIVFTVALLMNSRRLLKMTESIGSKIQRLFNIIEKRNKDWYAQRSVLYEAVIFQQRAGGGYESCQVIYVKTKRVVIERREQVLIMEP